MTHDVFIHFCGYEVNSVSKPTTATTTRTTMTTTTATAVKKTWENFMARFGTAQLLRPSRWREKGRKISNTGEKSYDTQTHGEATMSLSLSYCAGLRGLSTGA